MKVLIHDGGRHLRTYGFGRVARSIIDGVKEIGHTPLLSCPYPENEDQVPLAYERSFYQQTERHADICIQIGQPKSSIERRSVPLLFYTMFDTYTMPIDWKLHFSKADLIIVPTHQNARSLVENGINTTVLPLYDNTGIFKDRADWRSEGADHFSFIFVGTFSYRKSTQLLLEAFLREFDYSEARLILICTESNPDNTFNAISEIQGRLNKVMNIELVTQSLSDAWLNRYYNRADCFVSASKGEGWGYPMMEAGLTGLPCIVPDKLASVEFLRPESNFFIPSRTKDVVDIEANESSVSFQKAYMESSSSIVDIDISDLRNALRQAHDRGKKAVRTLGLQSAAHIRAHFDVDHFRRSLAEVLEFAMSNGVRRVER